MTCLCGCSHVCMYVLAEYLRWNPLLERLWRRANAALKEVLYNGRGLSPMLLKRLWVAQCRPILEYGCPLWDGAISQAWVDKLESLQLRFCRATLGLADGQPSAVGLRTEMDLVSLSYRRAKLKLGYWAHLCNADPSRILSVIFKYRHAEVLAGGARHSALWKFRRTLLEYDLGSDWRTMSADPGWQWRQTAEDRVMEAHKVKQARDRCEKSSLFNYVSLGLPPDCRIPLYLQDCSNTLGTN